MDTTLSKQYLKDSKALVEKRLAELMPPDCERPAPVHEAMNYSLRAGGKRLRPALVMASIDACGGRGGDGLDVGCAVEMIHTYTLIHDDLPCMDDDDLRRGRPSCHKAFGEAVALLAGDGLLTEAFGVIARTDTAKPQTKVKIIADLSRAVGSTGVIGGQVEDIICTGRSDIDFDTLTYIHSNKTAEFLACCARVGAVIAGADEETIDRMNRFGMHLGLAFQITDDILDIVGEREKMGKSIGKDENTNKATYPALLGLDGARQAAREHVDSALKSLENAVGAEKGKILAGFAQMVLDRDS